MSMKSKMAQYQAIGVQTGIVDADPHRLIQLLFSGAMENLATGKGFIQQNDIEQRNRSINKVLQIVGGLRVFLDKEKGGDLAGNLDRLYEYVELRLFQANVENDEVALEECLSLLKEIASAWDEIRPKAIAEDSSASD